MPARNSVEAAEDRWVLGVDEAGRGSLIGPLVVGGFLVPERRLDALARLGVRDSKLLSPTRREEIYAGLGSLGRRLAVPLPPSEVDRWVSRGQLNLLEAQTFAQLVRDTCADAAYMDACDPVAGRFGRTVAAMAGTRTTIVARHHADRDIPVVSAGSIVAKVRRDRAIHRLRDRLGADIGSGYPSDPKTVEFVRRQLQGGAATPSWLRRSWGTLERLKPPGLVRTIDSVWP